MRLRDFVFEGVVVLVICFAMLFMSGCYSARMYLAENREAIYSTGMDCVFSMPDEITESFGWTQRRNLVTGDYDLSSINYVTIGVMCKTLVDITTGETFSTPRVKHYTVTCDVTKKPEEQPCFNMVEWEVKN